MSNKIKLPQKAWFGAGEMEIGLPESWQVEVHDFHGAGRPALTPEQIKAAIGKPIGMAPLREYARGKKQVVILFDDMARVTRASAIVPHVLAELEAAGINEKQVRFICACGCHGALSRADFEKKLGADILKRFPVYNHAPFDNCEYVGTTQRGTKLHINAEVMKCDLKIGIGSIVPHIMAGFGGGGKLVLPGVASYETILALHQGSKRSFSSTISGMGNIEGNPRRQDIDEAAEIAGLDMKIDALVNGRGDAAMIFAGNPLQEFRAGLEEARKHYNTQSVKGMDVVIANSFAKVNEAISGLQMAFPAIKEDGGDVVLMANAPEGQVTHYLMGSFGTQIGGKLNLKMQPPDKIKRLIVYSEYPEVSIRRSMEDSDRVILAEKWEDVLNILGEERGDKTKAAVFPNADIQYVAD